ncbi:hypothetical protein VYA_15400 [Vibrio alfacsensis]|nr:hypothetical protein VA249_11480 [Vibrio alfacsensis]BCN24348.1 hypothetical protein VYA_15400 [Vibrio alfacsensis]
MSAIAVPKCSSPLNFIKMKEGMKTLKRISNKGFDFFVVVLLIISNDSIVSDTISLRGEVFTAQPQM